MCFTVRKINIMLSLLLVVVCSWGPVSYTHLTLPTKA